MPVRVQGPYGVAHTYALLDGGSTITVINKKFAHNLGLTGVEIDMAVRGLWGAEKQARCERLSFTISGQLGEHQIEHALAISQMNLPCQTLYRETANHIKQQVGITMEPFKNAKPLVLIGQDNWHLLRSYESRSIPSSGMVISRTLLGWVLHGYCENELDRTRTLNVHATCCTADFASVDEDKELETLDELVRKYLVLDNLGVEDSFAKNEKNDRVARAEKILRETTRKVGKTWETGLLWTSDVLPNSNTKATAFKRLRSLEKRQDRDPEFAAKYHAEMKRLIDNGYAVRVDKHKIPPRIRYISHFGVTNPNKPGKVRLVFDAAEKTDGVSMNDLLDTGPDLLESLVGVLTRFRQYPCAVKADIKDMYLRVNVIEADRGAQRFLYRGPDRKREPDEWEMKSLIFGSKSSPCSALYVKNTNAAQFARVKPEAARSIVRNSYMDDYLASGRNVEEMKKLVRDVNLINREANFEMHGWASNKPAAVEGVRAENKLDTNEKATLCNETERVLGLYWDRDADLLRFNVGLNKIKTNGATGESKPTKREVLSVAMSVYDPLGILSPFTLNAKLILQEIWISGVSWDAKIREGEFAKWKVWLRNLEQMGKCAIPRSFIPEGTDYASTQLHIFCDASKAAYAAVAYLRIVTLDGAVHVALVMGKSRLASTKLTTIPRLELQAARLGARLASTIGTELDIKINERFFWSDATTILHWIKTGPRTKQTFVANRIDEINKTTRVIDWYWVPTELNPADDGTRASNKPMSSTNRWFVGPQFLREQPRDWPRSKELGEVEKQEAEKLESRKEFIGTLFINKPRAWENSAQDRTSNWFKLLQKAISLRNLLHRACEKYKIVIERDIVEKNRTPVQNIIAAEKFWFRLIQAAYFSDELEALRKKRELPRGSKVISLRPYIDKDGLLRARGRVTRIFDKLSKKPQLEIHEFENTPIILNANHYATKLLIESYHERYFHANNETVVNELRQRFYIVGLRARLRWLAKNCATCRLKRAKPDNPPMADLPECRLAYEQHPFTHCGIDYFGPMTVKIGRRQEKRWGVLFTCMTTRAIHLELASTLSASSTIMAVQRMAARRGFPEHMYSDNGTNFVRAAKELRAAIAETSNEDSDQFAQTNRFTWSFNPPNAPHMGGAWERLIRSVKTALDHVLNGESRSEEVLMTLLAEVEHMVNSRPLTPVSTDPNDNEALTPNHFLIRRSSGYVKTTPRYFFEVINPRRTFEIAQNLAQSFWKRWLREYLPTIMVPRKWHKPTVPLREGDIVLILDNQTPRNSWKRGRVAEVYKNTSDGIIRSAKVRIGKSSLVRPVHKLIKISGSKE